MLFDPEDAAVGYGRSRRFRGIPVIGNPDAGSPMEGFHHHGVPRPTGSAPVHNGHSAPRLNV